MSAELAMLSLTEATRGYTMQVPSTLAVSLYQGVTKLGTIMRRGEECTNDSLVANRS